MRKILSVVSPALAMLGLLLMTTACQDLASDTGASTTTGVEEQDLSALFGTWDGTYTPDAAWDENGAVDDPPFELGEPVDMHMELHPWSAETADYGSIGAGDLYPAKVASLSLEDDQVTIIAITEAPGLDDLIGTFTLTLEGETLTGEEDSHPQVPSGWVSSSGSVYLTRTAPWDDSAAEDAAAESPSDGDSADGAGADDGAADEGAAEDGFAEQRMPVLSLSADDSEGHASIRVGDAVRVDLAFTPEDEVTEVLWNVTSTRVLGLDERWASEDPVTHLYSQWVGIFEGLEEGNAAITCMSRHADHTVHEVWRFFLVVDQ